MTKELEICSYREFLIAYLHKRFPKARKEDVEDAVQNALIKAVRFIDKWQGGSSLKTWLSIITVNMYVDTFRKTYVKNEFVLASNEDTFVFENIAIDDFSETYCHEDYQNKIVKELLSGLEDNIHVKMFCSHVIGDIDYKDLSIQQNVPVGTVKSRIFRAKKILKEKYLSLSEKNLEIV
jgi:RNA polymerase sigma-70 factor (ECF subfamily)